MEIGEGVYNSHLFRAEAKIEKKMLMVLKR